ncbi:transmembrane and coiled-coil domain-containing protein 4 isoform X2 [Protopterus annectens]|uniref:transmembrane and coiled-coil domain-containing protein 4 isoform X2 n=1 Tax=Protopterus annectens TaxID=7888 RepID=UPI001CFBD51F|nr:transmembrane and coiled-coil domain-containing protein 4 isoform X2 [Protopterus annectens]
MSTEARLQVDCKHPNHTDKNENTTDENRATFLAKASDVAKEEEAAEMVGKLLGEPGRFAYVGLCAISLATLFPEEEHSAFRNSFVEDLVKWLELCDSVIPVMEAFATGHAETGTEETFARVLLKDSVIKDKPVIIAQDLVAFSVKSGCYDARARVLIRHVTGILHIPFEELEAFEDSLVESLKGPYQDESDELEISRNKKEKRRKIKRYLLIGLATVGGGTVIGLTGGLAAPLLAAGAAAVIGTAGAAALGSTAGIAVMASLFGAAGAGLTGYKMKRRVGAIEEFEFVPLTEGSQLHITIAITGWLCTGKYGSFETPWRSLAHSKEQYCLAWESKYLMELGNALDLLLHGMVSMMTQEALKMTVLSGIVTALAWPGSILTFSGVIDNPWGVCLNRSAEVGKHLAHLLLSRQQGKRPVTLIGFSLGARVIFFCLQELAQEKGCEGIIEDVILLGAPVDGRAKSWKPLTKVVAGRIINGYCRGDWLLSFVYRSSSVRFCVAGVQPIELDDRRMINVDLSSAVNGHFDYMKQMDVILKTVAIKTKESSTEDIWNPNSSPRKSKEELSTRSTIKPEGADKLLPDNDFSESADNKTEPISSLPFAEKFCSNEKQSTNSVPMLPSFMADYDNTSAGDTLTGSESIHCKLRRVRSLPY